MGVHPGEDAGGTSGMRPSCTTHQLISAEGTEVQPHRQQMRPQLGWTFQEMLKKTLQNPRGQRDSLPSCCWITSGEQELNRRKNGAAVSGDGKHKQIKNSVGLSRHWGWEGWWELMDIKEEKIFQHCLNVPGAEGRWAHGNLGGFQNPAFPICLPKFSFTSSNIQISPHTSAKKTNCSVSRRAQQGMVDSPASSKAQSPMKDLSKSVTLIKVLWWGFGWNLGGNRVQRCFFLHWGYRGSYSLSMCLVVWKLKDLPSEKSVLKIWRGPPSVSTYFLRKEM